MGLYLTGFSTELDRVKNLPYCETETFEVKFDPRGANVELGDASTVLPIQVGRVELRFAIVFKGIDMWE